MIALDVYEGSFTTASKPHVEVLPVSCAGTGVAHITHATTRLVDTIRGTLIMVLGLRSLRNHDCEVLRPWPLSVLKITPKSSENVATWPVFARTSTETKSDQGGA